MNNICIINVGISGSGKTSWSTQYIKESPDFLRISRDDLRKVLVGTLDGYYNSPKLNFRERIINTLEIDLLDTYTMQNCDIIIDNTNLTEKYINRWINYFKSSDYSYDIKFKLFDCDLTKAKNRVVKRENFFVSLNDEHKNYCKEVDYIDKQFEQYKQIKQFIEKNYAEYILM